MDRTGKCLCGAVHFTIRDLGPEFGVCHCKMCQRWGGGPGFSFAVKSDSISFEGEDKVRRYKSSDWAERAFCGECGSSLWYKVTAPGQHADSYHMSLGLLDDTSGLKNTREIFVDMKPDAITLAGERERLNTEATLAMFGE